MCGKYIIPKKFSSCHPGFDPGSRFQFGFSRRIEAVSQDSGVKLAEEAKQRTVINYFSSPKFSTNTRPLRLQQRNSTSRTKQRYKQPNQKR